MPFTFKLSQRLARMRRAAVILASATALTACEKPIPSAPTQVRPQVATIDVSPVAATLFPSQSLRRKALVSSLATFRFGLANDSTLASRMTGAPRNVPGGERRQMSTALELYGLLILTVLGFTLPILTVLLSLFPEGVRALSAKSEHERAQSEENIRSETDKQKTEKGLDYAALEATLRSLKEKKHKAEVRLEYLRPSKLVVKIAAPFAVAFVTLLFALQDFPPALRLPLFLASLVAFGFGIAALLTSLSVLAQVSEIVNEERRGTEQTVLGLLSTLVEKSGADSLFVKEDKLVLRLNKTVVKKDGRLDFSANKKHEVSVSIENKGDIMAKKVEVGLILRKDVVVEKTPNLSLYAEEASQIVRFNVAVVHAHENHIKGKMGITFLRVGEYDIDVFIKGENVKYQRFTFKLRIVE